MKILKNKSSNYNDLKKLVHTKEKYKSFGDTLLNFLYSYHHYLKTKEVVGKKVKNEELQKALKETLPMIRVKGKKEAGDVVEALVGFCFLKNKVTINELMNLCKKDEFLKELITFCVNLL